MTAPTPYVDPPAARTRFANTLAKLADNRRVKLSDAERDELRRLSALWASTVPRPLPSDSSDSRIGD
jgi:hypothetical protein